MKKFWIISDTHGKHDELVVPKGINGVIHSGDGGTYKNPSSCRQDLHDCLRWLDLIDADPGCKIYVPGNHDTALQAGLINPEDYPSVTILNHASTTLGNLNVFGSPWTPWFYNWAYNAYPEQLAELWRQIPDDTDILVTHSPAHGILDECEDGHRAGCPYLMLRMEELKVKVHIFGHIHEDGYKHEHINGTDYYNASVLNLQYMKSNNGRIIELDI